MPQALMRPARDLMQMLAVPTNRSILAVLAVEPQYPRRLAELVALGEHEVSRRLKALERAGLIRGAWQNVGKTVRLYRLAASQFSVHVGRRGLTIARPGGPAVLEAGRLTEAPPRAVRPSP